MSCSSVRALVGLCLSLSASLKRCESVLLRLSQPDVHLDAGQMVSMRSPLSKERAASIAAGNVDLTAKDLIVEISSDFLGVRHLASLFMRLGLLQHARTHSW